MEKRSKKNAQLKLSFGMIFSIILIIIFLAFAFYAIKTFLGIQNSANIGIFLDDLQKDANKIWQSSQGAQEVEYRLPEKIEYICFADYAAKEGYGRHASKFRELKQTFWENENLFLWPVGSGNGLDSAQIIHIDIQKTTLSENPFCFQNKDGKVKMNLKMNFGESLVTITN
jgi:hypothetical protein